MTDPQTVLDAVAAQTGAISEVSRFVHDHPELGHEEHECSRYLCDTLAAAGLEVERGVAGMDTAFRATLRGSRPGRTTGFVCLYDAVAAVRPDGRTEAVHSCGHGPIAGAVTGAALALSSAPRRPGGHRRRHGLSRRRDPRPGHDRARRRQGDQCRGRSLGRRRRGALRAPRVHRHGVARVALDASRDRHGRRHTVAHDRRPAAVARGSGGAGDGPLARPRRRHARAARARRRRRGATRGSCSRRPSCCSAMRSRRWSRDWRSCGRRCPMRAGASVGLVEAVRPDDRVTAAVASRLPDARPRLRREPAAAPLRDGLRQHLAALPRRADRRRTRGRLGVPHGRGCGPVRVAGRRRGGV